MKNSISDTFRIWLLAELKQNRTQQKQLAEHLGITEVSVSRYINGDRLPNPNIMQEILSLFGSHIEIVKD